MVTVIVPSTKNPLTQDHQAYLDSVWFRFLEGLVAKANDQETRIASLEARVTALGG